MRSDVFTFMLQHETLLVDIAAENPVRNDNFRGGYAHHGGTNVRRDSHALPEEVHVRPT